MKSFSREKRGVDSGGNNDADMQMAQIIMGLRYITLLLFCQFPYMETCELQSIHSHPGMTGLTLE